MYAITLNLPKSKKKKKKSHFAILVNTGPYGAGHFKALLLPYSPSDVSQPPGAKLRENVSCHGGIHAIAFLATGQVLIGFWHFKFYHRSQWDNHRNAKYLENG